MSHKEEDGMGTERGRDKNAKATVIVDCKSYLNCIRLQIFLSKMKKYLVENKNQISYFILENFSQKKNNPIKTIILVRLVILVRTLMYGYFTMDAHGRSL